VIVSGLMPAYFLGMALFARRPKKMMAYQNHAGPPLFFGLLLSPLGLALAAFGKSRLRWITMIATLFALVTLYVTLMAANF